MKNLIYLISIMFALVLMNTSCTKPTDDTPIPVAITVDKLVGNWRFTSLTGTDGVARTDSAYLFAHYAQKGKINLTIRLKSGVITNCQVLFDYLNQVDSKDAYFDSYFDATNNTLSFPGTSLFSYIVTFEENTLVLMDSHNLSNTTITYRLHK